MPSNVFYFLFSLLLLFYPSLSCLDPAQPIDKCTQCLATQLLANGRCYDKIRGCLDHNMTTNFIIVCTTCQNGYNLRNESCERTAISDLMNGSKNASQVNNPAPVVPDNPANLTKENITNNNTDPQNSGSNGNSNPNGQGFPKILPQFPQIQLDKANSTNSKVQISSELQNQIATTFPALAGLIPAQTGKYELLSGGNKIQWFMYEQGTILIVEKLGNNIYKINEVLQNKVAQSLSKQIKENLLRSVGELAGVSLGINYQIKLFNNKTIYLNLDLASNKIGYISSTSECSPQNQQAFSTISTLPSYTQKSLYKMYLTWSYSQFLLQSKVANVPSTIQSVLVKTFSQINSNIIIFNITYGGRQRSQFSDEYTLIKYDISRNTSQIMGYYVQGQNILVLFNDIPTNPSKNTTNTTSTGSINNITANSNTTHNANQNSTNNTTNNATTTNTTKNNTINSNNTSTNATNTNKTNTTNITTNTTGGMLGSKGPIKSPTVTSVDSLVNILQKNTQFANITSKYYKILQFSNITAIANIPPTITYKVSLITLTSSFIITVTENLYTNQISQPIFTTTSPQSCADITSTNNQLIQKLNAYLKQSYPILLSFPIITNEISLGQGFENYIFLYTNEQYKRIIIQIRRIITENKFMIRRSQIYDNGYCFENKLIENMNYRLLQANDMTLESQGLKNLQPVINELLTNYKSYVYGSYIVTALTNTSHVKLYIQNKFATFEYTKNITESANGQPGGEFVLIEQKSGGELLPVGYKKEYAINTSYAGYENYKKIEDYLMRTYKTSFGGGSPQIMAQKLPEQQNYEFMFRTILGFFSITVSPISSAGTITTSGLKKISEIQLKTPSCKSNEHLDQIDQRCYPRLLGCYKQISSFCVMCEPGLILQPDLSQCKRSCSW